jgi:feruloyl esterase
MSRKRIFASLAVATCINLLSVTAAYAAAPVIGRGASACAALAGMSIPASEIGLPTTGAMISTARLVLPHSSHGDGEFCEVKGYILPASSDAPKMEFEVNLPTAWNLKAVQLGGGGFDGVLVTGLGHAALQPDSVRDPLGQGYVTLGSDGGHKGGAAFDGSFALNDEALLNFGQQSVKKTHDAAMAIIRARYGRAPKRFYFIGASQGGHEALDAAARYPDDYDGVVANYPAYNVTMLHLGSWNVGKALYENDGAGWLNPAKTKMLTEAVYAACDGLDGAKDGIISNVKACNTRFNIATVRAKFRCLDGKDTGDACLSDAQIDAVEKITSPFHVGFPIAGSDVFPRWALLEGALFHGPSTLGSRPVPTNPPTMADPLLYNAGSGTIKYIITRQPGFDPLAFKPDAWKARVQQSGWIMDVTDVDLTPFRRKGGKIILTHGTIDDFITPHNSETYYERQLARQGKVNLHAFMRFYMIPGFGHGFGLFNARYDSLEKIDRWVETGRAPDRPIAIDGNKDAHRTRPMCEVGSWPRYRGAGSVESATSFTCVKN